MELCSLLRLFDNSLLIDLQGVRLSVTAELFQGPRPCRRNLSLSGIHNEKEKQCMEIGWRRRLGERKE